MGNLTPGKRLQIERIKAGYLQRQVARETGIDSSLLSQFENDWRRPTPEQLARICAVIGISPDELDGSAA